MPNYYRGDRAHFIHREALLEVDCQENVLQLFRDLSVRPHSAIIVCQDGKPSRYVNGRKLLDAYLTAAKSDTDVGDETIRTFLDSPRPEVRGLKQVPVAHDVADVDLEPAGSLLNVGTPQLDRTLFRVVEDGKLVGYLFSHESFKGEADTPPPRFECTGPVRHTNRDPDSGTCYHCPFPIAKPAAS